MTQYLKSEKRILQVTHLQAQEQLMRVPWQRFRKAYEQYPRLLGLTLWTRTYAPAATHIPEIVRVAIERRCPGFLLGKVGDKPLDLLLLEWIHSQVFTNAKKKGWLDSLIFYGMRHPLSEGAWAKWQNHRSDSTVEPRSFESWWQSVTQYELLASVTAESLDRRIRDYIASRTFASWLSPIIRDNVTLPVYILRTMKMRYRDCPSIVALSGAQRQLKSSSLPLLLRRIEDYQFRDVKGDGWFGDLAARASSHPHLRRLLRYAKVWERVWPQESSTGYPSFSEWRLAADSYVAE